MAANEIVGAVIVGVTTVWAAIGTRRTSRDANTVQGFRDLITGLQKELERQGGELNTERTRTDALERENREQRRLARLHESWDLTMKRRLESITGETFPEPPPLYPLD